MSNPTDKKIINILPAVSEAKVRVPPKKILHRRKISKVLLIQPPAFCNNLRSDMNPNPPLGIAYIAAMLEREGYEVKILDAFIEGYDHEERVSPEKLLVGMPYSKISEYISRENPDVVGVTSMFTSQRKNAHKIAEITKKIDAHIVTIFGGAHPTSAPESVLEDSNVDFIAIGEGDNIIVPLLRAIEEDNDYYKLDGIGFHGEGGNPVIIEKVTQIEDLDTLPFPARHLLPMDKYFAAGVRHGGYSRGKRAASMITSRGCQYRCNFCTAFKVFTRKPRMRSIENVLLEIDEMVNKFQVDEIFFEDDQIIAKQRRAGDLFDAIGKNYSLIWDTPNGVSPWLLDAEIIEKMKNAGCYRINLAIESGNQYVLDKIINKPVKLDKVPELVKIIRSHGMEVNTFIVVGNIGKNGIETIEQIKDSFAFCRRLGLIPHVSLLTAYPGSEVLDVAIQKGYLIPGFDWDNLIIHKSQLTTPEWTPADLMNLVAYETMKTRWYLLFRYPTQTLSFMWGRFMDKPLETISKATKYISGSLKNVYVDVLSNKKSH